jgi:hypothetical protein
VSVGVAVDVGSGVSVGVLVIVGVTVGAAATVMLPGAVGSPVPGPVRPALWTKICWTAGDGAVIANWTKPVPRVASSVSRATAPDFGACSGKPALPLSHAVVPVGVFEALVPALKPPPPGMRYVTRSPTPELK